MAIKEDSPGIAGHYHDVYWEVLGGDRRCLKRTEVVAAIEKNSVRLTTGKRISKLLQFLQNYPGWGVCL